MKSLQSTMWKIIKSLFECEHDYGQCPLDIDPNKAGLFGGSVIQVDSTFRISRRTYLTSI